MAATKPTLINTWGNTNTSSPDMVTPSYIDSGFPAPSGGIAVKPPRGYINWLFNWLTNAVRYFMQRGISDWDVAESGYAVGSVVRYTSGGSTALDGTLYQLIGTATTGIAPPVDAGNWLPLLRRDAYGMPYGAYYEWLETWGNFSLWRNTAGTGLGIFNGRWVGNITGTDTNAQVLASAFGPNTPNNVFGGFNHVTGLNISLGKYVGNLVRLWDAAPMALLDDNVIASIEVVMAPPTADTGYWLFGFTGAAQEVNAINDGAFFIVNANTGGATYHARTIVNGAQTDQDTGVAVGSVVTPRRLRIVCRGANMGAGARQIQFYIDDAWVAASNANLPFINVGGTLVDGGSGAVQTILGGVRVTAASVASVCFFGPVRYAQRFKTL